MLSLLWRGRYTIVTLIQCLPRNFVTSFPYNVLKPYLVMPQVKTVTRPTTEQTAKQVAQEWVMKAAYYRGAFTQQARRETIVAALLILLGLILLLPAPEAGFILLICGAVAAAAAYTSFKYARAVYGEYKELREDHNKCSRTSFGRFRFAPLRSPPTQRSSRR